MVNSSVILCFRTRIKYFTVFFYYYYYYFLHSSLSEVYLINTISRKLFLRDCVLLYWKIRHLFINEVATLGIEHEAY